MSVSHLMRASAVFAAVNAYVDQKTEVPQAVEQAFDDFFVDHVTLTRKIANKPWATRDGNWNMLERGNALKGGKQPKHDSSETGKTRIIYVDAVKLSNGSGNEHIADWIAGEDGKYEMDGEAKSAVSAPGEASKLVEYKRQDGAKDKSLLVVHVAPAQGSTEKDWGSEKEFGLQGQIANFKAYKGALAAFAEASQYRDAMVIPMLGCLDWNMPDWLEDPAKSDYANAWSGPQWVREMGALLLARMALPADLQKKLIDDEKTVEFWQGGQEDACFKPLKTPNKIDSKPWLTSSSSTKEQKPDNRVTRWSVMRAAMRLAQDMNMDVGKMNVVTPTKPDEEEGEKEKKEEKKETEETKEGGMSTTVIVIIVVSVLLFIAAVVAAIMCFCKSNAEAADSDF